MWFRPGQPSGESDRFRVSSLKSKIKRKSKSDPSKPSGLIPGLSTESIHLVDTIVGGSIGGFCSMDNVVGTKFEISEDMPPPCPPPRKVGKSAAKEAKDKEKEKTLLTDRKFKNNRIQKSSSKGKISDLEKARTPRKTSAPPTLETKPPLVVVPPKKNIRSHSNLNLNALLKYKNYIGSSNKLKLNSTGGGDELKKSGRKSITEILDKSLDGDDDNYTANNGETVDGESNNKETVNCDQTTVVGNQVEGDLPIEEPVKSVNVVKKSSPSLTSRVAAKLSEASASSKAKKSKSSKKVRKVGRNSSDTINNSDDGNLFFVCLFVLETFLRSVIYFYVIFICCLYS